MSSTLEPVALCALYVDRANQHDLQGLADMLADDVDMFGGPCDIVGLTEFFAASPGIHWEVSAKGYSLTEAQTVLFAYTRTWYGPDGSRLAVDAEETISFNTEGRVQKIAYTTSPGPPRRMVRLSTTPNFGGVSL